MDSLDAATADAAAVHAASAVDAHATLSFPSGRWTGSGVEDPLEAELSFSDGQLSGRVCGPTLMTSATSWLDGDHFVRRFQMTGALAADGTTICGSMVMNDHAPGIPEMWVYCPDRTKLRR